MRLLRGLYDRVISWAAHKHAIWYLGGLSFAESSFFPIPPDVMLAPMALAKPSLSYRYALITTVTSVAGGVAGYAIGYFALEAITPVLVDTGYWARYLAVRNWFDEYGFWVVLAAGFSPIPYKLFTIAAGATGVFLPLFVLASIIGRGARFYLVAGLIRWGGASLNNWLRRYVDIIGWGVALLLVGVYFLMRAG